MLTIHVVHIIKKNIIIAKLERYLTIQVHDYKHVCTIISSAQHTYSSIYLLYIIAVAYTYLYHQAVNANR